MFTSHCSSFDGVVGSTTQNLIIMTADLKDHYADVCDVAHSTTEVKIMEDGDFAKTLPKLLGDSVWDNIAVLAHGSVDTHNKTFSLLGRTVSDSMGLIERDVGFKDLLQFFRLMRPHVRRELELYSCDVGSSDGFKHLLLVADEEFHNGTNNYR